MREKKTKISSFLPEAKATGQRMKAVVVVGLLLSLISTCLTCPSLFPCAYETLIKRTQPTVHS